MPQILKKKQSSTKLISKWFMDRKYSFRTTNLTYAEKFLIARIRHNHCIIRVKSSGHSKMRANAILFQNPIPKVYDILPPPKAELDEILACMFTGPCKPTHEDLLRTPLLVRHKKVTEALNWLLLNHIDYCDIKISKENMNQYEDGGIPVSIDYRQSIINKENEETSLHDTEGDDGVEEGDCSFVVHGLSGDKYCT